ncbi:hypothetical protein [Virgibacillus dokdonensis]|uniref:hypothetical protein n=1 Tax=Virgibacillus dokdonensis TaxID=302167 RepID=UPI00098AD899|nr:hypothetical protein [Virgibacillus dokdonensis]
MRRNDQEKYYLYLKAFINSVKAYQVSLDKDDIKKTVLYGVKMVNSAPEQKGFNEILDAFQLASAIKSTMGLLTPREFTNIFPIDKDFKGYKIEAKDYFYTKEYIEMLDKDVPIGENISEFLWEYMNGEVMNFEVELLCYMSSLRRAEGHLSLMEEFMASQGMETPNTFKNSKGEAMYIRDGKPEKIKETKSKHLAVVQ